MYKNGLPIQVDDEKRVTGIGRKDNQEILTRRAATMWLCRRKMHVKIGKNYPAENDRVLYSREK